MTQSKSKSSSSKKSSKKVTAPATSKKVKRTAAAKPMADAMPTFGTAPEALVESKPLAADLRVAVVAAPVREVSRPEFLELVRKEAYRSATRRNFKNGSPFQDWVNAEAAVSGKLAAEGARLS